MSRGKHLNFTNEISFTDLPNLRTHERAPLSFRFFLDINADDPDSRGLIIHSASTLDWALIKLEGQACWPSLRLKS